MFNSANVRRQIGIVKKRLLQNCELIQQLLTDYGVQLTQPTFTSLKDEEITNFKDELSDARLQLLRSYEKIEQLHNVWMTARNGNANEEQTYKEYISTYGDYTTTAQDAVSTLNNVDEILNAVDNDLLQRNLPVHAVNVAAQHHYAGHTTQQSTNNDSSTPSSRFTTTMNFVDASILSKLDLPTFDGNLLEFPEFFSRYTTLIGNKTELDDTTKFSLLKSCLRGRALHAIQGLALTKSNYKIAVDILKTSQLANLPSCDPEGRNLQSLYNKMFALTRQFCSYEDDSKEIALGAILINKLPRHIRSRIYDTTGNTRNLTPSELLNVLTDIVHKEATLQEIEFHCKRSSHTHEEGYAGIQQHRQGTNVSSLHDRTSRIKKTSTAVNKFDRPQRCSLCESTFHTAFNCDKFSTPQQRIKVVKRKRLCFNCLSAKHRTRECLSKKNCQNCSKRHHTSICLRQHRIVSQSTKNTATSATAKANSQVHFSNESILDTFKGNVVPDLNEVVASVHGNNSSNGKSVLMMCAEVNVFNPSKPEKSTKTVAFLDSGSSKSYITDDLAKSLELPEGEKEDIAMYTFGTSTPIPLSTTQHSLGIYTSQGIRLLNVKALQTLINDLKTIEIEDNGDLQKLTITTKKPSLLIGSDYFWEILLSEEFYVRTLSNGYHLVHSSIGDIITGTPLRLPSKTNYVYNSFAVDNDQLNKLVHRFWDLESEGVVDGSKTSEDEECLKKFNETTYFDNDESRYIVQLPFKGNKEDLPSNYQLAYARLLHNIRTLRHKPGMLEKYHNLIQEQLHNGIIEEVQEDQLPTNCHYLPHHAVLSDEKKTTKIRCVYDASAKTKGNPSLNDLLYRGPVLLPDISGILLRIRMPNILVSSDIEKAFLMVGLEKTSRDFTRFLWLKDPYRAAAKDNITTFRFQRVPFGLNVSPFLLSGTLHYHLTMSENPLSQRILRNTYVDNVFYGADSAQEAIDFYKKSKALFQEAGMNLREYCSNSKVANEFFSKAENSVISNDCKILGVKWDISKDTLTVQLPSVRTNENEWTKRKILKIIASTYDPLGWCSPVTFSSKVFLQSLWKENLEWDDVLPMSLEEKWKTLTSSWTTTTFTIPRRPTAAIALGSRLLRHICENLDVPIIKTVIWSDSSVALTWIKNGKEAPVFIRNRIKIVKENAPNANLRYVPSKDNPADVGSRGATANDLQQFQLWWNGPDLLSQEEDKWPSDITSDPTMKTYHAQEEEQLPPVPEPMLTLIDVTHFSTWNRLLRTVYYVLLFLVKKSARASLHFGQSSASVYIKAEEFLFRLAQKQHPPSTKLLTQLQLFEHNTLLKSKGRIANAELPQDATTPIFLPRKSQITSLYILHIHQENNHCGVNQTLCELRRKVWIPKGRIAVKRVINKMCFHCKRYRAVPFKLPEFPLHPCRRVKKPNYPFENIGMDFAGPLFYRKEDGTSAKYWILLITCLNTRAIYVDLISGMSSKTLFQAMRRFFASTAYPKWILCDNAKQFQAMEELQSYTADDQRKDDVISICAQRRIEFKFIPSFSPWQGGLYEKMVHIFKVSFKHALNNRILAMDELRTIAKETETIVNSRPLTYIAEDDRTTPLRPIDFIRPWANLSLPRMDEIAADWRPTSTTNQRLLEDWKTINEMLDRFWRKWTSEYLTSLREQYRMTHPHPRCFNESQPHEGDVVLIEDKALDRSQWKMGQILSSSDQFQRSACVRLPSNRTITRPISMLYKIEIDNDQNEAHGKALHQSQSSSPRNQHPMMTRSKTSSARLANVLTLVSIFAIYSPLSASARCSPEISLPKRVIYATNCANRGIAIAIHNHNGRDNLCWFPISCPIGAIRVPIPFQHNRGICGPECKCPSWTKTCSFSSSPRRNSSMISNVPFEMASYLPARVCSFTPTEKCDKRRRIDNFNQIQLYDDTLLIVPELHIIIKDYVDSQDFMCFDTKGIQRKAEQPYTGTSYFCNKNQCSDNAELFCTFGTSSAIYSSPDGKESLLVKAWGVTTGEYYGHLYIKQEETPISTRCSKGGIALQITSSTDAIETCVSNFCQFISNPTSSNVVFPAEIVAFEYTAEISAWCEGRLTYHQKLECPAYPICELLECTICLEQFYNPHCWSRGRMAIAAGIAILCLFIIALLQPTLRVMLFTLRLPYMLLRLLLRKVSSKITSNQRNLPAYTGHRRKLLLTILMISIETSVSCSDVVTIKATDEECVQHGNYNTCSVNQATIITLQPLNQETCLPLKSTDDSTIGLLTIRLEGIYFTCQKKIEFFTRDHRFYSESIHRCRFAGSCSSEACDNTRPTDKLSEFSNTANNHPGYTFCAASCGCLNCGGCFFCLASCLFYRYYAYPESPTIYTVFNCPLWEFTMDAHVTIQLNGHTERNTVRLQPAKTIRWNNIRLSLITSMVPQMPLLSSTFITNGKVTAITKPSVSGHLIPYTVGQLQCASIQDAEKFNCTFASNVCSCSIATNQATCSCSEGDVQQTLRNAALPQTTKNVVIYQKEKEIIAKTSFGTAIQLHVVTENLQMASIRRNASCSITASEISGCYSCLSGAHMTVACRSDDGEITASVDCQEQSHIITCTPSGHLNTLIFSFKSSTVQTKCNAFCPGGSINFDVKGQLSFVNDGIPFQEGKITNHRIKTHVDLSFVSDVLEFAKKPFKNIHSFISTIFSIKLLYFLMICFVIMIVIKAAAFIRKNQKFQKKSS